jgi:hypothetical protein
MLGDTQMEELMMKIEQGDDELMNANCGDGRGGMEEGVVSMSRSIAVPTSNSQDYQHQHHSPHGQHQHQHQHHLSQSHSSQFHHSQFNATTATTITSSSGGGFSSMMNPSECSICIDRISSGDDCVQLPCGHWFHTDCIKDAMRCDRRCPNCRHSMTAATTATATATAVITPSSSASFTSVSFSGLI